MHRSPQTGPVGPTGPSQTAVARAHRLRQMITTSPFVPRHEFEAGTGWELKPEGACRGEICIPVPDLDGDEVDIRLMAQAMRLPLVRDETHGVWALGSDVLGNETPVSAQAPELVLPDRDGDEFRLSSLKGEKVVLVAWAPY